MQEPLRNTSYNKVGSFNGSIAISSDDLVPEALYIFHSKKIVFSLHHHIFWEKNLYMVSYICIYVSLYIYVYLIKLSSYAAWFQTTSNTSTSSGVTSCT